MSVLKAIFCFTILVYFVYSDASCVGGACVGCKISDSFNNCV